MNHVIMMGNIASDPELKTFNDVSRVSFRIAIPRRIPDRNGERKSDFFTCVAWRRDAENIIKFARKGDKICVSGDIRTNEYTDRAGNNRLDYQINVTDWELCKRREEPKEEPTEPKFTPDDWDDTLPF